MTLSQNLCCCDCFVCFIQFLRKVTTISLYIRNQFFCKEVLSVYFTVRSVMWHIYYMTLSHECSRTVYSDQIFIQQATKSLLKKKKIFSLKTTCICVKLIFYRFVAECLLLFPVWCALYTRKIVIRTNFEVILPPPCVSAKIQPILVRQKQLPI
jgi:hypothetical protein